MKTVINGINIELTQSRGKKLRLTISPKTGEPKLHIPKGYPEEKAIQFALNNSDWIKKHRIEIKQKISKKEEESIIKNGGFITLWGEKYEVKIIKGGKLWRFSIDDDFFI